MNKLLEFMNSFSSNLLLVSSLTLDQEFMYFQLETKFKGLNVQWSISHSLVDLISFHKGLATDLTTSYNWFAFKSLVNVSSLIFHLDFPSSMPLIVSFHSFLKFYFKLSNISISLSSSIKFLILFLEELLGFILEITP